jgi:hypothetical protein
VASLFFIPFITSFSSSYDGGVLLSTAGSISDLYSHGSVSNKVAITNPIKQDAYLN